MFKLGKSYYLKIFFFVPAFQTKHFIILFLPLFLLFFARVSPIYSACLGSLKIGEVFSGLIKLNVFMLFLIAFFLIGLVFIVLHLIHLSHPVRLFAQVRRDFVTSG